ITILLRMLVYSTLSIGLAASVLFPNGPATTEIYTLSLHDALPIFRLSRVSDSSSRKNATTAVASRVSAYSPARTTPTPSTRVSRSEEHTSELQSRENLVCRLLLEKKKKL